jgi:hypothetical protein
MYFFGNTTIELHFFSFYIYTELEEVFGFGYLYVRAPRSLTPVELFVKRKM